MTAAILAQLTAFLSPKATTTRLTWGVVPTAELSTLKTPKKRKAVKHEEDALQAAVVKWFALQYPEWKGYFWATPNGGARSKRTAGILKATGTMSGVADLHLAVRRSNSAGLFLELKIGKNKPSKEQLTFLRNMETQGYTTAEAYDFNAARAAIVAHIGY